MKTTIKVKNATFIKVIFGTAIASFLFSLIIPALAIVPLWSLIATLKLNIILAIILEFIGLSIAVSVSGGVASFLAFIPLFVYAATQFADEDLHLGAKLKKAIRDVKGL
jgi:hypothetical protein